MTSTLDDARGELREAITNAIIANMTRLNGMVHAVDAIMEAIRAAPVPQCGAEAGREMLEAFQRIQGYSDNPGLVYTICSKMIDRLSPDQRTVAVSSAHHSIPVQAERLPKVRTSHHRNKEEAARLQALVDKRYVWPAGCHDPDSCARHFGCMYIQCPNMKKDGNDLAAEIRASVVSSTHHRTPEGK